MKKLVIGLFSVAIATVAQAATCNWSISGVKTPADSSVAGANYSVYLFVSEQSGDFGATTTTIDSVVSAINGGTFSTSGSYVAAKGTTNASGGITGATGYYGNFGAGDSITAFAIIFDGDYNAEVGGSYMVTAEKNAAWTSPTGSKTLAFGNMSTSGAQWQTYGVPEPTSGLLMLLGMAGIALRRRRA